MTDIKEGESVIKFVPYTPAGTACDWLASETEKMAWNRLLKDASHMPYKGVEGFKDRGYTVRQETWKRKS